MPNPCSDECLALCLARTFELKAVSLHHYPEDGHGGSDDGEVSVTSASLEVAQLGPDSIEEFWLEFWFENWHEFWLEIPYT